ITNLQERLDNSDPFTAENGTGGTTGNDGNGTGNTGNNGNGTGDTSDVTVLIPFVDPDDAPEIDGEITINNNNVAGVWANAVSSDISGAPLAINNLMVDINADHVNNLILRRWWAMHDGDYLYILVLSDDSGLRFSDSERAWHDDSLELYIDGDNSKLPSYGDDDDIQVTIPLQPLNSTSSNESDDGRFSFGAGSTVTSLDIEFETGIGIGPDGLRVSRWEQDIYELRIAIDSAGIAVGKAFGFELQINDDDDGGVRDGKWGWFHPERTNADVDFTHLNPSIMGTVILQND
ncbi:MAG: CBM9 family sugar-binding protein, partial [Gammaproteobacteria bacterium]|nr:CBM9 family sugar-binding protein [Gammaproteobacteria bacterium]